MCGKHYMQKHRYGIIKERTRFDRNEIVIKDKHAEVYTYNNNSEKTNIVLIDIDDIKKVKDYKICFNGNSVSISINGKLVILSRFLMNCLSSKMEVDHKNRNVLDNRRQNLRIVTRQQNNLNRYFSENVGLYFLDKKRKWRATIKLNNKTIYLGCYKNKDDAIKARKIGEKKYFGDYRCV